MQHPHGGAPPPPPPPAPQGGVYAEQPPQQAAPRQDGIPYIGSRISLISKTDIRYEGFLFNIDTRQSMVALQHVRSFGTEGRRAEHIPPSDQVLPYATFKASEIKDLHVCEAAPPPTYPGAGVYAQPPPPPMPQQPYQHYQQQPPQAQAQPQAPQAPQASQAPRAPVPPLQSPVKKTQSPVKAKPTAGPTLLTPGSFQTKPEAPKRQEYTQPPPQQQQYQQQQYQQQPQQQYQQPPHRQQQQQQQYQAPPANDASSHSHNNRAAQSNASRTIPGMGDHLLKRKERRVPGGAEGGLASVSSGSDFNFEQGLGGFDKEEEFSKLSVDDNKAKGSYQKSSFFDTISCDALDRLEGKQGRVTMSQERKLNTETFGAVGLNNNRRGFRGGRGGGGGGRGGGRRSNYNGGGSRNGGGGGRGGNNNRGDQWSTRGVGGRDPTSA